MEPEPPIQPDEEQFSAIWRRSVRSDNVSAVWIALDRGYSGPSRHYHDWSHIGNMLDGLERAKEQADFSAVRFDEVALAIYFHDAVYDPARSDNEEKSAQMFLDSAGGDPNLRQDGLERVADMILATKTHADGQDSATRLMLDLDLAVLGGEPPTYDRYTAAVRKEYAWVDDAAWRSGRAAVLRKFLKRDHIYHTALFQDRFETLARENIGRELGVLEA